MKKILYLLVFFLQQAHCQENNIYENCYFLSDSISCESISDALRHLETGNFNKHFGNNVYHKIPHNKSVWFHFKREANEQPAFFTIANTYLHHGKIYQANKQGIDSLPTINYFENFGFKNVNYRHPTWKLNPIKSTTDYFVQIKDSEPKTRLELYLTPLNEFLKRNQIEYFLLGTTLTFLASLMLILACLFITKQQFSLLWYASFIFFIMITILANKGVGAQYFWSDIDFLINSAKSCSQTLALMSAAFFYANFYPLKKKFKFIKKIFSAIGFTCVGLCLVYAYKIFNDILPNWYLFVWVILKISLLIIGAIHIYLLIKKVIPAYLAFGFIASITGTFTYQLHNPTSSPSLLKSYFFTDIFYLTIIFELTLMMYYIISEIVRNSLLKTVLEKENLSLKTSFLSIEDEQKKLFSSNVHDTFGSYIEALQLQTLNKQLDKEKLNEIIKAFRKEYQFLLTSMFSPKVNEENFVNTIQNFCKRMESLSDIKFVFDYQNNSKNAINEHHAQEIFKIINELTTNAIKHADADTISIQIFILKDEIHLQVEDDGIGLQKQKSIKGVGIESVKNRTSLLNGIISIDSENNVGTTIKITLLTQD